MLDHAQLRECEGDEYSDDIELDEARRLGLEADDQRDRGDGEDDDAVRVRQSVAAAHHLVGQEGIARQDGCQRREAVERRIAREHQDEASDDGDEDEEDRSLTEHRGGDLRDRRINRRVLRDGRALVGQLGGGVVDDLHAGRARQNEDRDHHGGGNQTEHRECCRRVAGLGAAEHGHAVGDGLDTGECGAARGEGAHEQEGSREPRQTVGVARSSHEVVGSRGRLPEVSRRHLRETNDDHQANGSHVQVGGHGERATGLARSAQVQSGQDDDERDRDRHLIAEEGRDGRRDVVGSRRNRDGDRQDVVDQQRRGHEQAPGAAQVRGDDLVIAAARRVGVYRLTVRRNHDRKHDRDDDAHPHGLKRGHRTGERKGEEDFVRRVGDGRQRVRCEDRQGDSFGEKLVAHRVRSHRAPDEHALCVGQQVRHGC